MKVAEHLSEQLCKNGGAARRRFLVIDEKPEGSKRPPPGRRLIRVNFIYASILVSANQFHRLISTILVLSSPPYPTFISLSFFARLVQTPARLPLFSQLRYVYIDDGPYLDSLEHLVEHYSTLADGLQCRLRHPLPPSAEDAHRAITDNRRVRGRREWCVCGSSGRWAVC